jgi:hypothetical protein
VVAERGVAQRASRDESGDEILLHGEPLEDAAAFRTMADPPPRDPMGGHAGDRLPGEADNARVDIGEPTDRVEERRLAGPVRPNDCYDFAVN